MGDPPSPLCFKMPAESGMRGAIVSDNEYRVQYTDSKICDLLGVEAADLVGKSMVEIAGTILNGHFSSPEEFEKRTIWLSENPGETSEDVMELVSPAKRVLHRYSTPLFDTNDRPVARIDVYSDITKRRQLEDANASLYKQVCTAYEELKAAQDQLVQSEKLRAIGEIASGVAHDFNNTLGIILGNIQLLLRANLDEKVLSRLRSIEQAARDATETVRRIREFTCMQPEESLKPVDMKALISSVLEMMEGGWETEMQMKGIKIKVESSVEDDICVAGVAAEIREVLANIVINAVQAMPNGGSLTIDCKRADEYAALEVSDTGIGMSEEVVGRVFDPFFTTKGVEGTGLGMSVVYGIVKRHQGKISVSSEPGEGTTIRVMFPLASSCPADADESGQKGEVLSRKPVSILIVEDEEGFAEVFTDMLSEYGHQVCVARSGDQAIERFQVGKFDLVFTDLGMPGMSGWQVAKSIKGINPSTPIVLLTGWGAAVEQEQLVNSGIDMVLSKPINIDDLSKVISQVMDKRGTAAGELCR